MHWISAEQLHSAVGPWISEKKNVFEVPHETLLRFLESLLGFLHPKVVLVTDCILWIG